MKNEAKRYFPLFMDLSQKQVVVVGAGRIASRRVQTLTDFTIHICVIAPEISDRILQLEEKGCVTVKRKSYEPEDLTGSDFVIAATSDTQLNRRIYEEGKKQGMLVNVISDRTLCDFHFPGIVFEEEVTIGIHAGGSNHRLAKDTREELQTYFRKKGDRHE